jgi:negative regulator of genetic competence, sporulation and motility
MKWFNRDKKPTVEVQATRVQAEDDRVEVVVHKNATNEALAKADEANQKLNELLVTNGFTLKIYLATGGSHARENR